MAPSKVIQASRINILNVMLDPESRVDIISLAFYGLWPFYHALCVREAAGLSKAVERSQCNAVSDLLWLYARLETEGRQLPLSDEDQAELLSLTRRAQVATELGISLLELMPPFPFKDAQ